MAPIRVLLADDHEIVRVGIRRLLENIDGVDIIAEAGDGEQALALADTAHPDVAVLDITMPKLDGIEVVERLAARDHPIATLILSVHEEGEYVSRALRAGAFGYMLKSAWVEELEVALRAVARGDRYLSPGISKQVVDEYLHGGGVPTPLEGLTPRQREIVKLVAQGNTSKEIAERLGLSIKTVETHRAHVMERIGAKDLTAVVRFAVRSGLIEA